MGSVHSDTPTTSRLPPDVRDTVFVVVAAYNEAACLQGVAEKIRHCYPNLVVVDDGSEDDTFEIAKRSATYTLGHLINRGQGAALQTGIEFALSHGARFIVTFDADGQHCVEDIETLVAPIHRGECDITLGSRFLGRTVDMPASRRRALRWAVLFTRIVNGVKLTDAHNGLRAFSRRAAKLIHITNDRMAHASELIDLVKRSRLSFKEVPVQIKYSPYSLAKGQSLRDSIRIIIHYLFGKVGQ